MTATWRPISEFNPTEQEDRDVLISGFEENDPQRKRWKDFGTHNPVDGQWYDDEGDLFFPPTHFMFVEKL